MSLNRAFYSERTFNYIVVLSCILLFFINIRNDQDWGDDNAQYIHQAKNITQGIPQYETGYIYNENFPILGPTAYTIGFPLILSPDYAFFGNNTIAFNYLLTLFLLFLVIVFSRWTKNYISGWKGILLILLFVYHPWVIRFKSEINSEIPFTFLLLGIIYQFDKPDKSNTSVISIALLSGLLISVRPIGFVVPIAIFIHMLNKYFHKNEVTKRQFISMGILTPILSFVIFFVLNYLIFPASSGMQMGHQLRSHLFNFDLSMAYQHFNLYCDIFKYFIQTNTELTFSFLGTIGKKLFMLFLVIGFILRIRKSLGVSEIIFVLYLLVILFYNYANAGFRFLLPIAPLCFFYAGNGIDQISKFIPYRKVWVFLSIIAYVLLYFPEWSDIKSKEEIVQYGPMKEDAQMMFQYLKTETTNADTILFIKPRALSLYTQRISFSNHPNENQDTLKKEIAENHIRYLLLCKELPNPSMELYLKNNPNSFQIKKTSGDFELYKITFER